jgi:hypothetical protein
MTLARLRSFSGYLVVLLTLAIGIIGCTSATDPDRPPPNARKILFIGNSFTYSNDLPAMVGALARKVGVDDLHIESVTFGGVSLQDHWSNGTARQRLAEESWDLVIMQQGPSSQPDSRVLLMEYAQRFNTEIRAAGARPAFFMVWPDVSRPQDFDGVSHNYRAAADSTDGMLFPGGEAWRAVWRRSASTVLYSPDGLHPTTLGTYVVALTMVGMISGTPIVGMPIELVVDGTTVRIAPGIAALVQEAAAEAVRDFGRM